MRLFNRKKSGGKKQTVLMVDEDFFQLLQLKDGKIICNKIRKLTGEETLKELLGESVFPVKKATVLVGGNRVIFKAFRVPAEARKRLDEFINLNFLEKLSLPVGDLYYSYLLVNALDNNISNNIGKENKKENYQDKKEKHTGEGGYTLLAFAVKKVFVNRFYQWCCSSGIKVEMLFPVSPLFYLFHRDQGMEGLKYRGRSIIYLDYFSNFSHFSVSAPGQPYLRCLPAGDIRELKLETDKVISYLFRENKSVPVMVFNGREIIRSEDAKGIEKSELLKVVNDQNLNENYRELFWREIVGLLRDRELRSLDLKKELNAVKKSGERKRTLATYFFITLLILLNLLSLGLRWRLGEEKLARVKEEMAYLESEVALVEELKENYLLKREKLELYQGILNEDRTAYLPWLAELSRVLPPGTEITTLHFRENKLLLLEGSTERASGVMRDRKSVV